MAKTIHIRSNALWRREGAGLVILEEVTGEPYHLDEVGAYVFEALEPGPSLDELVEVVGAEYAGDAETVRADLELFLSGLLELNLIEVHP